MGQRITQGASDSQAKGDRKNLSHKNEYHFMVNSQGTKRTQHEAKRCKSLSLNAYFDSLKHRPKQGPTLLCNIVGPNARHTSSIQQHVSETHHIHSNTLVWSNKQHMQSCQHASAHDTSPDAEPNFQARFKAGHSVQAPAPGPGHPLSNDPRIFLKTIQKAHLRAKKPSPHPHPQPQRQTA